MNVIELNGIQYYHCPNNASRLECTMHDAPSLWRTSFRIKEMLFELSISKEFENIDSSFFFSSSSSVLNIQSRQSFLNFRLEDKFDDDAIFHHLERVKRGNSVDTTRTKYDFASQSVIPSTIRRYEHPARFAFVSTHTLCVDVASVLLAISEIAPETRASSIFFADRCLRWNEGRTKFSSFFLVTRAVFFFFFFPSLPFPFQTVRSSDRVGT